MLCAWVPPAVSQGLTPSRNEMQLKCPKRSDESRGTYRRCMHAWQRDDTVKDDHTETRQRRTNLVLFSFSTFIFIGQMNAWKRWPRNETTYCSDFQWKQTISWLAQSEVQFVPWSHFVPGDLPLQGLNSKGGGAGRWVMPTYSAYKQNRASFCLQV